MTITKEQQFQNKRKHWSNEEKNKFIQSWKESKLSQSEFCRQNNLSIVTFSNWIRKFKKQSKSTLLFSPMQLNKAINNQLRIKIELPNGLKLNVTDLESVQTIYELVESLMKCHP